MRFACWITKATNTHSEYVLWALCSVCFELRGGLYISVRIIHVNHFVWNVHHTDAGWLAVCLSGDHYQNFRVFSVLCKRHPSYFISVSLSSAVGHFVISERLFSAVICTLWLKRLCSEYFTCFLYSLCAVWRQIGCPEEAVTMKRYKKAFPYKHPSRNTQYTCAQ